MHSKRNVNTKNFSRNKNLFDNETVKAICKIVNEADVECSELYKDEFIVSEIDFTSKFTDRLMQKIADKLRNKDASINTQLLKANKEREIGADACIVLANIKTGNCKICLYEAKIFKNKFDYKQGQDGNSHFGQQIIKQNKIVNKPFAIWEQFYNSKKSICFWSSIAYRYMLKFNKLNNIWIPPDIIRLKTQDIATTIKSVCMSNQGRLLHNQECTRYVNEINPAITLKIAKEIKASPSMYFKAT